MFFTFPKNNDILYARVPYNVFRMQNNIAFQIVGNNILFTPYLTN